MKNIQPKVNPNSYLLTKEQRILALLQAGFANASQIWRKIYHKVHCTLRNVQQIVNKIKNKEYIERKIGSDTGKSSLLKIKKKIVKFIDENHHDTSIIINQKFKLTQSRNTIYKFIKNEQIVFYIAYEQQPLINEIQRKKRLEFAKNHDANSCI